MMEQVDLNKTTDATVWAAEFERCKQKNGWSIADIDEELMIVWFADAMCAQMDKDAAEIQRLKAALAFLDPRDVKGTLELLSERDALRAVCEKWLSIIRNFTGNMVHTKLIFRLADEIEEALSS